MFDFSAWSSDKQIDIVKTVDISGLPAQENRGMPTAVILVKALPKAFIRTLNNDENAEHTDFYQTKKYIEEAADALADALTDSGYQAFSQSGTGLNKRGEYNKEMKITPLPHKKVAVLAGIGWIGKNNLLVTEEYGCAVCICSVLTDLPVEKTSEPVMITPRCGNCEICVKVCPPRVLHGKTWEPGISRDEIVNVFGCVKCLKCLTQCPYSRAYAKYFTPAQT